MSLLNIFFGIVKPEYYKLISPVSLIVLGIIIDKKAQNESYVGRLSMFSNSMALASFYIFIPNAPIWIRIIVNIAIILGMIGIIAYAIDKSLTHNNYYKYTRWFSPIITGILILIYYIFPNLFK